MKISTTKRALLLGHVAGIATSVLIFVTALLVTQQFRTPVAEAKDEKLANTYRVYPSDDLFHSAVLGASKVIQKDANLIIAYKFDSICSKINVKADAVEIPFAGVGYIKTNSAGAEYIHTSSFKENQLPSLKIICNEPSTLITTWDEFPAMGSPPNDVLYFIANHDSQKFALQALGEKASLIGIEQAQLYK